MWLVIALVFFVLFLLHGAGDKLNYATYERLVKEDEENHNYNDDRQQELMANSLRQTEVLYTIYTGDPDSEFIKKLKKQYIDKEGKYLLTYDDCRHPEFVKVDYIMLQMGIQSKRYALMHMAREIMKHEGYDYRPQKDTWQRKYWAEKNKKSIQDYTGTPFEGL